MAAGHQAMIGRLCALAALWLGGVTWANPFLTDLETRSLRYFLENSHPATGLVRDRAYNSRPRREQDSSYRIASLAATGFGLAVLANASARGRIRPEVAREGIGRALRFAARYLEHRRGWLYHFVDWETGRRWGNSEISTVDTAWFIAGALYAAAIFPVPEITEPARFLYERIDFHDMMTDDGLRPEKRTLSMGWMPESGFLPWQWDTYAEHMVLVLLGLGHPTRPLPAEAWHAWARTGPTLPLFAHQYSQLFIDFRKQRDGIADYFAMSVEATERDRRQCAADTRYRTYREGFWGLSASGSASGYLAFSPTFHDGTVCPGCAGASIVFAPEVVARDLERWAHGPYAEKIWGDYGFVDSMNLDKNWFDPDVIGITVGAMYLALADLDPRHAIWDDFVEIPEMKRALRRAGFRPLPAD